MSGPHQLSKQDARRIAVVAQGLAADSWTSDDEVEDVVRRLTLLQNDPTKAVAPNADLILWSRLGCRHRAADLRNALDELRLIELHGYIRPAEDVALYRAEMAAWPGAEPLKGWQRENADWLEANNDCREEILELLRGDGPLPTRSFPDTCVLPWRSSGWNNNKNVPMLLELLVARGEIAIAGRDGRDRLWDLASRIYPDEPIVPVDDAVRRRNERRLSALGIAKAKSTKVPGEPNHIGEVGEAAVIDGVPGEWRVDPTYLDQPFTGRTALLSPLDRLVFDRKRTLEIFDFDYQLEMYKPAAKRRWGYFALPILHGEQLVGKLDATADHKEGEFRVTAIHQDVQFSRAMASAVDEQIEDLARWVGLPVIPA